MKPSLLNLIGTRKVEIVVYSKHCCRYFRSDSGLCFFLHKCYPSEMCAQAICMHKSAPKTDTNQNTKTSVSKASAIRLNGPVILK